ncbi:MAG: glycoside hydrolase family 57 [Candidatus Omnitrophica bacterium 4484_70.2]|nr:MAG: glycoside hydrolase family 57 [Candidatus Omnitrophica bacterium 4484_70.2]
MEKVYYSCGLHMHQPPGNLKLLIETNEWEAQQIIRCYERAARYAHKYKKVATLCIGFSGILLEQFEDKEVIEKYKKFVDIPAMIEMYRKAKNIEIIGMGYYHPIFPLIPKEDWEEQLKLGREMVERVFGQKPKGFWPSEMAFCMEMIPALKKAGYEYVVVDHVHLRPHSSEGKPDVFIPYRATYNGSQITVVPRNRDISNAQESGMDPGWFSNEVNHKIKENLSKEKARLVVTWSDGENGGWFRQMDENSGFFGHFFAPFMERVERKEVNIRPIKISDYLKKYPPTKEATVNTGAWNVGSTTGYDFSQWNGFPSQREAIANLFEVSRRYWEVRQERKGKLTKEKRERIKQARKLILEAETSCYLFWGDAWIPKIYQKLNQARELLK